MHMDTRVIEVTDFKSEVRFDLLDNLESNIGKLPLQVMRGSPLVLSVIASGKPNATDKASL